MLIIPLPEDAGVLPWQPAGNAVVSLQRNILRGTCFANLEVLYRRCLTRCCTLGTVGNKLGYWDAPRVRVIYAVLIYQTSNCQVPFMVSLMALSTIAVLGLHRYAPGCERYVERVVANGTQNDVLAGACPRSRSAEFWARAEPQRDANAVTNRWADGCLSLHPGWDAVCYAPRRSVRLRGFEPGGRHLGIDQAAQENQERAVMGRYGFSQNKRAASI